MFRGFILGMDTFVLDLIKAAEIIEDGRIDEFTEKKYASFKSGIGERILSNKASLEELAEYAAELKDVKMPGSGSQEYLESIMNSIMFG